MIEFLDSLNTYANTYAPLINAAMMAATVGAVIVALVAIRQAAAQSRLRIVYNVGIRSIYMPTSIAPDGANYTFSHQTVSASLYNRGMVTGSIDPLSFGLHVLCGPTSAQIMPATPMELTPIDIPVQGLISLELRTLDQLTSEIVSLRPRIFPRWRCSNFRMTVATRSGVVFHANIERHLRSAVRDRLKAVKLIYDSTGATAGVPATQWNGPPP